MNIFKVSLSFIVIQEDVSKHQFKPKCVCLKMLLFIIIIFLLSAGGSDPIDLWRLGALPLLQRPSSLSYCFASPSPQAMLVGYGPAI